MERVVKQDMYFFLVILGRKIDNRCVSVLSRLINCGSTLKEAAILRLHVSAGAHNVDLLRVTAGVRKDEIKLNIIKQGFICSVCVCVCLTIRCI